MTLTRKDKRILYKAAELVKTDGWGSCGAISLAEGSEKILKYSCAWMFTYCHFYGQEPFTLWLSDVTDQDLKNLRVMLILTFAHCAEDVL